MKIGNFFSAWMDSSHVRLKSSHRGPCWSLTWTVRTKNWKYWVDLSIEFSPTWTRTSDDQHVVHIFVEHLQSESTREERCRWTCRETRDELSIERRCKYRADLHRRIRNQLTFEHFRRNPPEIKSSSSLKCPSAQVLCCWWLSVSDVCLLVVVLHHWLPDRREWRDMQMFRHRVCLRTDRHAMGGKDLFFLEDWFNE